MATILVIDDEPDYLNNIVQLLEFEDFRVIASLNGSEALESLQAGLVDLILCDILMQPLNGFEILHALRQNPQTAQIPLVFVTGVQWNPAQLAIIGTTDYLIKPFTTDKLLAVVRTQLKI